MTESSSSYIDYVLAEIRCAVLRGELIVNDLTAIGIALRSGFIDPDSALEHLADCGVLRLLASPSPITTFASS